MEDVRQMYRKRSLSNSSRRSLASVNANSATATRPIPTSGSQGGGSHSGTPASHAVTRHSSSIVTVMRICCAHCITILKLVLIYQISNFVGTRVPYLRYVKSWPLFNYQHKFSFFYFLLSYTFNGHSLLIVKFTSSSAHLNYYFS